MIKDAYISRDGLYRYSLLRDWSPEDTMLFIMLNPSTADADLDDPTIRRCIGFAQREGCGALEVVNLFAFRATDPADMKAAEDPVGPNNDQTIREALHASEAPKHVVCGWGVHGSFMDRDKAVYELVWNMGYQPMALGVTKDGHPRHPLYLKNDAPLVPWRPQPI